MPIHERILYIGPYREFSGAGNSARNYIEALYKKGHEVCISPLFPTGDLYPENDISSEILPLENNYQKTYDIVIQHCHPFDYVYDHRFSKNIGIYQFNSLNIKPIIFSRLDLMDNIVVNSNINLETINRTANTKLSDKLRLVPELIDLNKIKDKQYSKYEWIKKLNDPYIFYVIGNFIERKNFYKILSAFVYSFDTECNVELVIKTKNHYSIDDIGLIEKELDYMMNKIYGSVRKQKERCKQPKIMVGKFSYDALLSMHSNLDCYIDVSQAENFGYGVLEAASFNNDIITNELSSSTEIVPSYKVSSKITNANDSLTKNFIENNLTDIWSDVDFNSLVNAMKTAEINRYNKVNNYDLSEYDYHNVNKLLC